MKNIFRLFTLVFCLLSTFAGAQKKAPTNKEYIDCSVAKINGVAGMGGLSSTLYRTLGKPDSIVKPNMELVCTSYYNKPFKYVYIKGSMFELYGNKAFVLSLNFKGSDIKVVAGKLVLDKNTTLTSLNKLFPVAVKEQSNILLRNIKAVVISIAPGKNVSDDDWLLFFENGKLIQMDSHTPC